jgi:hypothetical protein
MGRKLGSFADYIQRIMAPSANRPAESYGDVQLSIQASSTHYCSPRVDGLTLAEYVTVEVGIIDRQGNLCRPSAVGVAGFDDLFEDGAQPVAGHLSQAGVAAIRKALAARAEAAALRTT